MGKITINVYKCGIFHSYLKLPEGSILEHMCLETPGGSTFCWQSQIRQLERGDHRTRTLFWEGNGRVRS